ncbi:unnamed protein product [Caenorhabditis brenneri]
MYSVQWEGHPNSANSWEPETNLRRCEKRVQEFKKVSLILHLLVCRKALLQKQIADRHLEANENRDNRANQGTI